MARTVPCTRTKYDLSRPIVGRPHKHTRVHFVQQLHIFWIEITYFAEKYANSLQRDPHATKEK